jgi:hypothetical protein
MLKSLICFLCLSAPLSTATSAFLGVSLTTLLAGIDKVEFLQDIIQMSPRNNTNIVMERIRG